MGRGQDGGVGGGGGGETADTTVKVHAVKKPKLPCIVSPLWNLNQVKIGHALPAAAIRPFPFRFSQVSFPIRIKYKLMWVVNSDFYL